MMYAGMVVGVFKSERTRRMMILKAAKIAVNIVHCFL